MDVPVAVEMDGAVDLDEAVIVALGCNDKGAWRDCREAMEAALARFRSEGIDVVVRSSWWRSRAWPDPDDPPFLNGVVIVRTRHDPHALMAALGRIEEAFGRRRDARNAPRTDGRQVPGQLVDQIVDRCVLHLIRFQSVRRAS